MSDDKVDGDAALQPADAAADSAPMDDEAARKAKQKEKEKLKKQRQKENKKKEKDEKEEKGKDKKAPGKKAPVAAIKEALKKKQEEEERERQRIEDEERRADELQKEREDKLRQEKERKEREKQKKKERIARQKREGTYLTPEEKERRRRAQAQLELLKAQGLIVQGSARGDKKNRDTPHKESPSDEQTTEAVGEAKEQTQPEMAEEPSVGSKESAASDDETQSESGQSVADDWLDQHDEDEDAADAGGDKAQPGGSDDQVTNGHVGDEKKADTNKAAAAVSPRVSEKEAESPAPVASSRPQDPPEKIPHNETKEEARARIVNRIRNRGKAALAASNASPSLRSPVVCVLGHVDTGKTKMLDRIRRTNVQDNEAGGITQQIGATRVPSYTIVEQGKGVKGFKPESLKLPGFLVIDTPGHESFSNLRSRGSSLCDLAILIVDIMHGLEPQTIESINLLRKRNTPFVIALNKVDMLYNWKSDPRKDIQALLKSQPHNVQLQFKELVDVVKQQFQEQGLNACLYWENEDMDDYISMVPTSARVGDGVGNIMVYLAHFAQQRLADRLTFVNNVQCTVLEVKALTGLGMTIDVILVNGTLRVGDTIIVAGYDGPIVTSVRELLMPHPLKELRVKNQYEHHKEIRGAQGIKMLAKDLDKALAGTPLAVAYKDDEIDILCEDVDNYVRKALETFRLKLSSVGVYVQASTLGSLEALLEFLRVQKIPYCGINIGPVHKKDVMKASTMLEHDAQWAVILAFDVKLEREAETIADDLGVKVFTADIIYHLEDAFIKHREEQKQREKQRHAHLAVYPAKVRALPQHVFKSRDPIVMGVSIDAGQLKVGTPLCVPSKECLQLGSVSSIEINNKAVDIAKAGQEVCIKIENTTGDAPRMYGRHFDHEDVIVSKITRESIDVCKKYFREELTKSDWQLVVELKKMLDIR